MLDLSHLPDLFNIAELAAAFAAGGVAVGLLQRVWLNATYEIVKTLSWRYTRTRWAEAAVPADMRPGRHRLGWRAELFGWRPTPGAPQPAETGWTATAGEPEPTPAALPSAAAAREPGVHRATYTGRATVTYPAPTPIPQVLALDELAARRVRRDAALATMRAHAAELLSTIEWPLHVDRDAWPPAPVRRPLPISKTARAAFLRLVAAQATRADAERMIPALAGA
jgi:hypothetical protein